MPDAVIETDGSWSSDRCTKYSICKQRQRAQNSIPQLVDRSRAYRIWDQQIGAQKTK